MAEGEADVQVVVLGLGNLLMSDEGAGVRALELLRDDPRVPAEAILVDGGTLGLELISYAAEATHLLVLDAVDVGEAPGTVVRLDQAAMARLPGAASVHQLGVADLLNAVRLLGNEPTEVVLLGIQPAVTSLGTTLTEPVAASLPKLVAAARRELERWSSPAAREVALCTR